MNRAEAFDMLEAIRVSGAVNMFGAGPVLAELADIDETEAQVHLLAWIDHRGGGRATRPVGTPGQWEQVDASAISDDPDETERADVARRDARLFGTDPSWFGFND